MNSLDCAYTFVSRHKNRLIGRIKATSHVLAQPVVHSKKNQGSLDGAEQWLCSSYFPYGGASVPKNIRESLRQLCMSNYPDIQTISSLQIWSNVLKLVTVYFEGTFFKFYVYPEETGAEFCKRFASDKKRCLGQPLMLFSFCVYSKEFTRILEDLQQPLWKYLSNKDNIYIAHGKIDCTTSTPYEEIDVVLESRDGTQDQMSFISCELGSSFKNRVKALGNRPLHSTNICLVYYKAWRICDGDVMIKYGIKSGETLKKSWVATGGGGLTLMVDLGKSSIRNQQGVSKGPSWRTYKRGMNIVGACSNANCASLRDTVCVSLGYPRNLVLTESKNNFECPACNHKPVLIKTFLVSDCRARFRFTKTRQSEIETFILEAPSSSYSDYAKLEEDDIRSSKKTEYDYIEVTTASFGTSFNSCQCCTKEMMTSEEKIMRCGRSFHKSCLLENNHCPICELPEFNLNDLPFVMNSIDDKIATIEVPNQVFGCCHTDDLKDGGAVVSGKAASLGIFMKALASSQLEESIRSETCDVELQQNFIIENLPSLIKTTVVNTLVIAKLRQLSVLSEYDEETLVSIKIGTEKSRELYKMVGSRASGIVSLLAALEETSQSGAVLILSGYFKYKQGL